MNIPTWDRLAQVSPLSDDADPVRPSGLHPPDYLPLCAGEATDVEAVHRLLRQSRQAAPAERVSTLRAAAALWRGPALADVTGLPWLDQQAVQLAQLRLDVVRALVDARSATGEHAQLVPELSALAREQPLDDGSTRN